MSFCAPENIHHCDQSKWQRFYSLFLLADIEVLAHWELANNYWPTAYVQLVLENPWWLVKTKAGLIKIGWRKRVMSIDWSDTPIRQIITEDETTKELTMVHAWSEEDALRYLKALSPLLDSKREPVEVPS